MIDFLQHLEVRRGNVFPAMLQELSSRLGLRTIQPFLDLGVGYDPLTGAWLFPERDVTGKITGLIQRLTDDQKFVLAGSKRGLYFVVNPDAVEGVSRYRSGAHNWTRVTGDNPCPICDSTSWCLISNDEVAVICPRTKKGETASLGEAGHLHILKPEGHLVSASAGLLLPSSLPVLITEGCSDWLTATELGFVSIGKASATHRVKNLADLMGGRHVIIIGDNNPIGIKGVEETFAAIHSTALSVIKVFPPEAVKDLRSWYKQGLTQETLIQYTADHGEAFADGNTLPSLAPLRVAEVWIREEHTRSGVSILRDYHEQFLRYKDGWYQDYERTQLRGNLYRFLDTRNCMRGDKLTPVDPNQAFLNNVIDSLSATCPIDYDPPFWLDGGSHPDPADLIVFKNGMLNMREYYSGVINLMPHDPRYFTMAAIPHNFNPDAKCPLTEETMWDYCSEDEEKYWALLEWAGYLMVPDMSMEKMMLLVGQPRSGKGTYISMILHMLGEKQVTATSFASLCGTFGLQQMVGKLAAFLADASVPKHIDSLQALQKIKTISGGDSVDVQRKFKPALASVYLKVRFTIAVNTLPELPDHSKALESRLNLIHFTESYMGREDRTRKERLKPEVEGQINLFLQGLCRLRKQKEFTCPKSSTAMLGELTTITTPMVGFVEDCCTLDSNATITKSQLFDTWTAWAQRNGCHVGTLPQLGQRLLSLHPSISSQRIMHEDHSISVYSGIAVQQWARTAFLKEP